MTKIRLVPTKDYPDLLTEPLQWSLDLWGHGRDEFTPEDWRNFYKRVIASNYQNWDHQSNDQELLFLAMPIDSNEVLGVIGLCDFDDLEEFRHLKPWICAFIVREDLRGRGLGKKILIEMELLIKRYGIEKIYLWTENQANFYLKLGYEKIDELNKPKRKIHVMCKELK